jgi:hypothetical protein
MMAMGTATSGILNQRSGIYGITESDGSILITDRTGKTQRLVDVTAEPATGRELEFAWPVANSEPKTPTGASAVGRRINPETKEPSCHTGIDIAAPAGTSIKAAEKGLVLEAGYSSVYGNFVTLTHSGGIRTFYAHMQQRSSLTVGDPVGRGKVIGRVGSTGVSTGPHLHFEVRVNVEGDYVPHNPMGWYGLASKTPIACAVS